MMTPRSRSVKRPGGRAVGRTGGKDLELYTLGGLRLLRQGADETSKLGAKHLALLVYVFHEQRPMHPSEVIDLLGRGQEEGKEFDALKRAVAWLRENVPGVSVRLTAETIEALGGLRLDTREVDSAIDDGDATCVAAFYSGDFLEGFQSGAPAFDEWAQKERGRLRRAWSHAILTAAQESERRGNWDVAAQWWEILVARAPMRPEAVVGLLRAYAQSGAEEEAARVYSEYLIRLRQSGIAQPAEAVQQLVARHPKLQEIAAQAPPPAADAGAVQPTPRPPSTPVAPPPRPEPRFATAPPLPHGAPRQPRRPSEPPAAPERPRPGAEPEIVSGFQPGTSPPLEESEPFTEPPVSESASAPAAGTDEALSPEQDQAWQEIVDMSTGDQLDLSVAEVPEAPAAPPARPAEPEQDSLLPETEKPAAPQPAAGARPGPRPSGRQGADLWEAAAAATDKYAGVRHEITSVRKPWGRVLREAWDEAAPWRAAAREHAASGLERAVAAAAVLPASLGQFLRGAGRLIWSAICSLAVLRRPFKAAGRGLGGVAGRARTRRQRAAVELQEALTQPLESKSALLDAPAGPAAPEVAPRGKVVAPELEPPVGPLEPPVERRELLTEPIEPPARGIEPTPAPWERVAEPVEPPAKPLEPAPRPVERVAARVEAPAKPFEVLAKPRKRKRKRRSALKAVRRHWYVPVALAVVGLGVAFGPYLVARIGLRGELPQVRAPSLPRVSLPKVTLRTPAFVETSISRIGQLFSGPLLDEPGQWTVVADVEIDDEARADYSATAMTVALEAELTQSRFFSVVPRERALIARGRGTVSSAESLPGADALALAEAEGYAAVISARVSRVGGVDSVAIRVLSPAGEELYGVAAAISGEASGLETLLGLTRPVRRRLGEPGTEVAASLPATHILSSSSVALEAYARARMHLFAGRYSEAIAAARDATREDSSFAMAYRTLAEAYALGGQRTRARSALDSAHQLIDHVSEREGLRILADRLAWNGHYADAALTYDQLFQLYRDDVAALRSQALLQRIIGVRGGGEGNLRVAYTIDPYDWPPLARVARYLGYSGRLPDVDSLVAALERSP